MAAVYVALVSTAAFLLAGGGPDNGDTTTDALLVSALVWSFLAGLITADLRLLWIPGVLTVVSFAVYWVVPYPSPFGLFEQDALWGVGMVFLAVYEMAALAAGIFVGNWLARSRQAA